jgi:hypothetical protein
MISRQFLNSQSQKECTHVVVGATINNCSVSLLVSVFDAVKERIALRILAMSIQSISRALRFGTFSCRQLLLLSIYKEGRVLSCLKLEQQP